MKKILVINGPNLNMLGIREKEIYGCQCYEDLVRIATESCEKNGYECECYQSNHEGAIVDKIQSAYFEDFVGIIINPAAFTHTSIAILDALKAVKLPAIEVHISDVAARENFRAVSYAGMACIKTISGKGLLGYAEAADELGLHLAIREKDELR